MPSYMTVVVLALAASNASTALSLPIQEIRDRYDQNLSRRQGPDPVTQNGAPPLQHGAPPFWNGAQNGAPPHQNGAPALGIPSASPEAAPPKGTPAKPPKDVAVPKGGGIKSMGANFIVGTAATMLGIYLLDQFRGGSSNQATSSGSSGSSSSSANQYPQYYPQYQQRAVDHDKRADIFGPSEAKPTSISDNNRRATSHLDLSSRRDADLGEALKLFKRVLDELD